MDTLSPRQRSERMSRVRSKDTGPERIVRRVLTVLGYRYRLQRRDLPGRPDIVLGRMRIVVLVHGCFWHRHACVNGRRLPKSRIAFWRGKLEANRLRDLRNRRALRRLGWSVLVIWECQTRNLPSLEKKAQRFLDRQELSACGVASTRR